MFITWFSSISFCCFISVSTSSRFKLGHADNETALDPMHTGNSLCILIMYSQSSSSLAQLSRLGNTLIYQKKKLQDTLRMTLPDQCIEYPQKDISIYLLDK